MLPTPPPPTDNLYKFMALAGLTLVVAGVLYPQILSEKQPERFNELTGINALATEFRQVRASFENAPHIKMPDGGPGYDVREFNARMDTFTEHFKAYEAARENQKKSDDHFAWWKRVCYGAATTGGIVAVIGFWLWATRLQRHQDLLLRHQVAEAELKAKDKPASA